jgi:hypothetical protein
MLAASVAFAIASCATGPNPIIYWIASCSAVLLSWQGELLYRIGSIKNRVGNFIIKTLCYILLAEPLFNLVANQIKLFMKFF